MKREELEELHFITLHSNLPTLLKYGIQSHRRAEIGRRRKILEAGSVAMQEVQDIREGVRVPEGLELHEYANLYLCARNPMMYKRHARHLEICVLRVSTDVLDMEGAVVTEYERSEAHSSLCPSTARSGLRQQRDGVRGRLEPTA